MRVAILCGSLAQGKDGVGDYTWQLGREIVARGHDCQLIALADREVVIAEVHTPVAGLSVLRIPYDGLAPASAAQARTALDRFAPDSVSMQMVCYAFDPRGILRRALASVAMLRGPWRRHLMLHELWVGIGQGAPLRQRLLGQLQCHYLLAWMKGWSPHAIHTSNPVYQSVLRGHGVNAAVLPLPGNIEPLGISRPDARQWLLQQLPDPLRNACPGPIVLGLFGSIHPEWHSFGWLDDLLRAADAHKRPLIIVHVGRMGERGCAVWRQLLWTFGSRLTAIALGERPASEISRVLLGIDCGIATSPWAVVGKSGSVAAMLEHGTPVLVTRDDFRLRSGATPEPAVHPLLFVGNRKNCERVASGELRHGPVLRVNVADPLLTSFEAQATYDPVFVNEELALGVQREARQ